MNLPVVELREYSPDLGLTLDLFTFEAMSNNAISQENAERLRLFGENILASSILESLDEICENENFVCSAPQPVAAALRLIHDFYPEEEVRLKPRIGASWLTRTVLACEDYSGSETDIMQHAPNYALACVIGPLEREIDHPRGLVVLSNPKKAQALTMTTPNWPGLITEDWFRFIYSRYRQGSGKKDQALDAIKFNFELSLFEPSCDRRDFYSSVFTNYRQLGLEARIPNIKNKFEK